MRAGAPRRATLLLLLLHHDVVRVAHAAAATPPGAVETVKVGILHSLTGTLAAGETAVVQAEQLAIDEINARGGILGRQIETEIRDGASSEDVFKEKAVELIDLGVPVIFGVWASSIRNAVAPIFAERDHMLWYPVQYEGQECKKNIFYAGACPNEQIEPAVDWLLARKGKTFFLIGSDYAFPRTANKIIRNMVQNDGGTVAFETYYQLGDSAIGPAFGDLRRTCPNGCVIANTLNGDQNVALFRGLVENGFAPEEYPVMSFSVAEVGVQQIGVPNIVGQYAAWNYFMTIDSPQNNKWIADMRAKYGQDTVTDDPMEAAYTMVHLWAQAVEQAGTTEIEAVRRATIGQKFDAPHGPVEVTASHHLTKTVRIGQVRADGLFDILIESPSPIMPVPMSSNVEETAGIVCNPQNLDLTEFMSDTKVISGVELAEDGSLRWRYMRRVCSTCEIRPVKQDVFGWVQPGTDELTEWDYADPQGWRTNGAFECGFVHQSPVALPDPSAPASKDYVKAGPVFARLWQPRKIVIKEAYAELQLTDRSLDYILWKEGITLTLGTHTQQFQLERCAIHTPSEHTIGGVRYAAEMQWRFVPTDLPGYGIVGRQKRYPEVVVSQLVQPDSLASADSLLSLAHVDRDLLEAVQENTKMTVPVNLSTGSLFDGRFFSYEGSRTTPPCQETVTWYVSTTPVRASPPQLATLRRHVWGKMSGLSAGGVPPPAPPLLWSGGAAATAGNARPLQPINSRPVTAHTFFSSDGSSY